MSKVVTNIANLCFLFVAFQYTLRPEVVANTTVNTISKTNIVIKNSTLASTEQSTTGNDTQSDEELNINSTNSDTDNTSKDYGTVIESDLEQSSSTNVEYVTDIGNVTKNTGINGTMKNRTHNSRVPSVKDALRDIAYYLRSYKFNEYDRRYETNPEAAPRSYFKEFPRPPLRSLHWEVHKHCEPSFSDCVEYLRKKIRHVSLKRFDDTSVVMQEQNWTYLNNSEQIQQIDQECNKLKAIGDASAEPFEGPLERFQWRVTASYFMCWYTMQQAPALKQLSDHCDNFADCLSTFGPNNKDPRADDSRPYDCALYSFCPDPCCPKKHLNRLEDCWEFVENPCFHANSPGQRECSVNQSSNTEFRDIVLNRWNVSCRCPPGLEWNSRYGMCVDVDECAEEEGRRQRCDGKLHQACVNVKGSFRCACIWGHVWASPKNSCVPSEALRLIKLTHKRDNQGSEEKPEPLIRKLTKFFRRSKSNTVSIDKIAFFSNLLCVLLCFHLF